MAYTSRDRDRGRLAVATVTGLGAVGALTATGWLAGVAASQAAQEDSSSDASASPTTTNGDGPGRRELRQRPSVTRVTVRYVPADAPVAPAAGGSLTSPAPAPRTSSTPSSSPPFSSSRPGVVVLRVVVLRVVGVLRTEQRVVTGVRAHRTLDAFGSYLFVGVRRPSALDPVARLVAAVAVDLDATCSRFRDDSDLVRANTAAGRWVDVDPLLVAAVDVACRAAEATGGLVNPLLGRTLVQLGYDRDFASLAPPVGTVHPGDPAAPDPPAPDAWRAIGTRPGAVRVPAGTALDLGSTGKAWAADVMASAIEAEYGEPVLVSVGGDVRIAHPDGEPWEIAVSERLGDAVQQQVNLTDGGLATSSTRVRRWSHAGVVRHHLLDPRTGTPAEEVWRTVTATGPTCVAANTAATAAVVLGAAAPGWLAERDVAARLQPRRGRVVTTGAWPVPTSSGLVA